MFNFVFMTLVVIGISAKMFTAFLNANEKREMKRAGNVNLQIEMALVRHQRMIEKFEAFNNAQTQELSNNIVEVSTIKPSNVIEVDFKQQQQEAITLSLAQSARKAEKAEQDRIKAIKKSKASNMIVDLDENTKLDLNQKHLLVSGITGSGKSVGVDSIINQLINNNKNIELHLVDMKNGLEAFKWNDAKQVKTISTNMEESLNVLTALNKEYDRRCDMFKEMKVQNINQFNKKTTDFKLPNIVLIVDEMAQLMGNKEAVQRITSLIQVVRAVGITVISATQTVGTDTVPSRLRDNYHYKLAFMASNASSAKVAQGGNYEKGGLNAQDLLGQGHGLLCEAGKNNIEIHGLYLSEEDVEKTVKNNS